MFATRLRRSASCQAAEAISGNNESRFSTNFGVEPEFLRQGDVLLNTLGGGSVGRSGYYDRNDNEPVVTDGHIMVIRTTSYESKFLFYYLRSRGAELEKMATGSTNQSFFNLGDIANLPIPCPPGILIQRRIVSYLDEKTAAIDARVAVLEKKLAAYKRLKTSVINRAVTRGAPGWGKRDDRDHRDERDASREPLATHCRSASGAKTQGRRVPEVAEVSYVPCHGRPVDRPLRDSGVDWIGKVPVGWEVDKIGNCFDVIGSGTTPRTGSQDLYEGEIPWVQSGDLHDDWVRKTSKCVNEEALQNYSLTVYKAPFICVAMYGASIGNASKIGIDACTNQACCALCKPRPEISLEFMYYLLCQSQERLMLFAEGGTQPNINRGTITGLRVGLPPLTEQRAIADYLDAECAKIDKMAVLVTREIELYKNLKRSLINEVVTGKREVA